MASTSSSACPSTSAWRPDSWATSARKCPGPWRRDGNHVTQPVALGDGDRRPSARRTFPVRVRRPRTGASPRADSAARCRIGRCARSPARSAPGTSGDACCSRQAARPGPCLLRSWNHPPNTARAGRRATLRPRSARPCRCPPTARRRTSSARPTSDRDSSGRLAGRAAIAPAAPHRSGRRRTSRRRPPAAPGRRHWAAAVRPAAGASSFR